MTAHEYLRKVLKRIMSKENMSENQKEELISWSVKEFEIKEKQYFISHGLEFNKATHMPRNLQKANKLLKSYHKNNMKAKYEEEEDYVFMKEITDRKLGQIFNCMQIYVNWMEYFDIDSEDVNINNFILREINTSDTLLNAHELLNIMKPYMDQEETFWY
jgi:hypothetical protein